jgi:hypothetical protein
VGPLVEQLYGSARFLVLYVLTAATASLASFLLGPGPSVGASGALFGLCGVLLVGRALHRPVLQGQQRAIMSQIGFLVVINLVFGFGFNSLGGNVDNFAHLGGLAGGLWLGLLIPPIGTSELPLVGRRSGGGMPGSRTSQVDAAGTADSAAVVGGRNEAIRVGGLAIGLLRWAGVAALVVVVLAAVVLGGGRHA